MGAIAPNGSIDPILATNPIGLAIPTKQSPITADFATSKRVWGEIRVAKSEKRMLPEGTFMDNDGNLTTDPEKVGQFFPLANTKVT